MGKILIFLGVITSTFALSVEAHPGRTNSEGCHNNRKTGDYHCHGGGSARNSSQSSHRITRMQCTDFDSQDEAQEYFERTRDRRLDRDRDGVACETQFGGGSSGHTASSATDAQVYSVASLPKLVNKNVEGRVVSIADGDTLTVLDSDNVQHKIRLNAIDAPEMGQPFGQAAKKELSDICYNANAEVKYIDTDKYGRMVGEVFCNGVAASQSMLSLGYAWVYEKYSKGFENYYDSQTAAMRQKKGLWQDTLPIPPWEWRDGTRPPANSRSNEGRGDDIVDRIEKAVGQIFRGLF